MTELKYSTSPHILFETAVLKASMPQADYDIEALIARIATLEKKLENGEFTVKTEGRYEMKAPKSEPVAETKPAVVPEQQAPTKATDVYGDEYMGVCAPPDEDETGGNAYFDGFAPAPKKENVKTEPVQPIVQEKPRVVKPMTGDAKSTFGSFLRCMRKIARNGVLLTLCMDLDGEYEDGTFVLYTTSDTIYRSLTKAEHSALIAKAFAELGFEAGQYDVRLRGKQSDDFQKSLNEIKATFEGIRVEVK